MWGERPARGELDSSEEGEEEQEGERGNNFVFNSESFDNNIIESCNDFINDISAFNNISDENIRLERISNYFLDFKNELINDDNSMIYRIEDRNRKVISSHTLAF